MAAAILDSHNSCIRMILWLCVLSMEWHAGHVVLWCVRELLRLENVVLCLN